MSTEVTTEDEAAKCDNTTEKEEEDESTEDNHPKEDQNEEKQDEVVVDAVIQVIPFKVDLNDTDPEKRCSAENALKDPPKQSWLLRLFESKLFDMTIAITYLYNSKESGLLKISQNSVLTCTNLLFFSQAYSLISAIGCSLFHLKTSTTFSLN